MRFRVLAALVVLTPPTTSRAQAGGASLSGRVRDAVSGEAIVGAAIAIPALRRSTSADSIGRFKMQGLRPGSYDVVVRRVGYSPNTQRLTTREGEELEHDVELLRLASLDPISVTAHGVIASFEEHRALGLGKFLDRSELATQETRRLADVISQFPGVRVSSGRTGASWLSSSRGVKSLNPKSCGSLDIADVRQGAKPCECYAQVYLDKSTLYRGGGVTGEPLFNLNSISVDQIESIEYFAGPAQTPLEYSKLNSTCGVLVIHSRR